MKPIRTLILGLAAAIVAYSVSAADLPPSADSTTSARGKARPEAKLLGMVLGDPTAQEMDRYQMESPLPLVLQLKDPSFFPKGMEPTQGCAFWILEPPANGFLFNHQNKAGRRCPKTVRELVQAIIACTIGPEEYQRLWEQSTRAARELAEKLQDRPKERERWLSIADMKIPPDEAGKYICRVVYNYPGRRGTVTTRIRMSKFDLERLHDLLKNSVSTPHVPIESLFSGNGKLSAKFEVGVSACSPSGKLFQDGLREKLLDLAVPGDRLRHPCAGVLIPIVLPSMSNQNAPHFLYLLYEVSAFHATSNSATFRTAGICPPDKSAYKSRRCS